MIKPIKASFYLGLLLTGLFSSEAFSQKQGLFSRQKVVNQYATFGIGGGTSHYFGDLTTYKYAYYGLYTNVRWNGSINYTRYLTSKAAARVSYSYARLLGDDYTYSQRNLEKLSANYLRNLHFRNDISEFTLTGIFNIMPQYGKGARGRSNIMPYVAVGLGIIGHNPKARNELGFDQTTGEPVKSDWEPLKQYNTSGQGLPGNTTKPYSLVVPVMPIAIGIRVKLNKNFDFTAEAGFRLTATDYLDDVGGNGQYPAPGLLNTTYGPTAAKFSYRADEDYSARTGNNRIGPFLQAAQNFGATVGAGTAPSLNAENIYNYSNKRGTPRPDSYLLTQFTISYVLSNSIKCPNIP